MNAKLAASSLLLATLVLSGCTSYSEPEPYEIISKRFKGKTTEQGDKLFSFLVAVKAGSEELVNKKQKLTKQEMRKLIKQENFIDSGVLKLELEDHAADLLAEELKQRNYCAGDHQIEEVQWRDYSVRLSGRCIKETDAAS